MPGSSDPEPDVPENLIQSDLEIDESVTGDSALGDDTASLSTSINSSVLNYITENGRRYHAFKDGSYLYPNDDTENDRLDLQHAVFLKSLDGQLYAAPLKEDPEHVLDVGTGTGIWAIDFADQHPESNVTGTDLSPIQPSWVPPNLSFLIDDAEDEWVFEYKFDYIHFRMMTGSLKDYPSLFQQAFDNMKPGAYIELQDINLPVRADDDSLTPDMPLWQWNEFMFEAGTALERSMKMTRHYKRMLKEAGFVDVVEIIHKWPQNNWPKSAKHKEIGLWTMQNFLQGLTGLTMRALTMGLGMSQQEVEVFLAGVRKDIINPQIRSYWQIHFVYGRKP